MDWALMEYYLAHEESIQILDRAIELNRQRDHRGDLAKALTLSVTIHETHGHAVIAKDHADEAVALLGQDGPLWDLATAQSRYAYLLIHMGEGLLADSIIDEALVSAADSGNELAHMRALSVKGLLGYVRGQPGALDLVEQARGWAEQHGHRFEEVKALRGVAYIAQEINDLSMQEDYAQRARDSAARYELPVLEAEGKTVYVDALMRGGRWAAAEDLAIESLGSHANADIHLMRVLGTLRTRSGRSGGTGYLEQAWALAEASTEIDYLIHVAAALAERMWLTGVVDDGLIEEFGELVVRGIQQEFPWPAGWLAFWLWMLGKLDEVPSGTPDPHAFSIQGEVARAGAAWETRRMPYRRAMALICGSTDDRLEAMGILESLGAEAVAAKVRKDLREAGVVVPRGKGRATREHAAGLTARQAEILALLAERLSNPDIADRLFLSPRTVENHVSAVLAKLDSSTRDEAVSEAHTRGLI